MRLCLQNPHCFPGRQTVSILTRFTAALKLLFFSLLSIGRVDMIVFETDVDKISTQIFFEGKKYISLPEDIIKRLNKFKKVHFF